MANTPSQAPATVKSVFQTGDQLELFVREDPTLNGTYLVREGGYIVIPRAGRLPVVGMSREEAEAKVKDFLKKSQLKEANVIVERTANLASGAPTSGGASGGGAVQRVMIYVTGSVPRSGAHYIPVPPGRTIGVYEALLISGGLGKYAKVDTVNVFRMDASGRRQKTVIDLRRIINGEEVDPPIAEADIINVPEKVFGF